MPIFAYFTRVGGALLGMLLLVSFVVEPSKPEPQQAAAAIEKMIAKPRTMTKPTEPNETYRAALDSEPSSARNFRAPIQQPRAGQLDQTSAALTEPRVEPKRKTAKSREKLRNINITAALRYDTSAYASTARHAWYSSAENRHAPQ
jgi:hypothetical protein